MCAKDLEKTLAGTPIFVAKKSDEIPVLKVRTLYTTVTCDGPKTRVGQPEMKYWKLHELHMQNEVKNVHPI